MERKRRERKSERQQDRKATHCLHLPGLFFLTALTHVECKPCIAGVSSCFVQSSRLQDLPPQNLHIKPLCTSHVISHFLLARGGEVLAEMWSSIRPFVLLVASVGTAGSGIAGASLRAAFTLPAPISQNTKAELESTSMQRSRSDMTLLLQEI
jgi:hypothetical protein